MKRAIALSAMSCLFACGGESARAPAPSAPAAPSAKASTTTSAGTEQPVDASWGPLADIAGSWEGASDDGASKGTLKITADLGGKVLVRRGTNDSPQGHHEDLTIVSRARDGGFHGDYFDNEGHVIRYAITASPDKKQIVFTSEGPEGAPRFRLTYDRKGADDLGILFEMAPPGATEFKKFTGGVVHRKR